MTDFIDEYVKRRISLAGDIKCRSSSKIVTRLLHRAIAESDACFETYNILLQAVDSFLAHMEHEVEKLRQAGLDLARLKQSYAAHEETLQYEEMLPELRQSIKEALAVLGKEQDLPADFVQLKSKMHMETLRKLRAILFQSIYPENEAEFIRGAVKETANALVSTIPVAGNGVGAIVAILNILQARRKVVTTANKYVGMLESYISAAQAWCLVAQMVINLLEADTFGHALNPSQVVADCEQRCNEALAKVEREFPPSRWTV